MTCTCTCGLAACLQVTGLSCRVISYAHCLTSHVATILGKIVQYETGVQEKNLVVFTQAHHRPYGVSVLTEVLWHHIHVYMYPVGVKHDVVYQQVLGLSYFRSGTQPQCLAIQGSCLYHNYDRYALQICWREWLIFIKHVWSKQRYRTHGIYRVCWCGIYKAYKTIIK